MKTFHWTILILILSSCASLPGQDHQRQGLFEKLSILPTARNYHERDIARSVDFASWDWPLKQVDVTSPFGRRGRRNHEGIDLKASVGTPVYAAEKGRVVYSGSRISGYGKMVVIEHQAGIYSVYAHHSKNLVRKGQWIKKSQQIALSGRTGRVSGPHLHFEIRRGVKALDPAEVLGSERKKIAKTR